MSRFRSFVVGSLVFTTLAAWDGLAEGLADEALVRQQLRQSLEQYPTPIAWTERRMAIREAFLKGAGLWPLPARSVPPVIRYGYRQFDEYTVENVAIETFPGFYCLGNLYRPLQLRGPCPVILCPHGHFQPLGRYREEHQIRCAHLARMGALVFSYGMVGWQDSRQTTHDDPQILALQTWNSLRAVDWLVHLSEADPRRIGVTGASGGGTQSIYLGLIDERVRAVAPVVIVYPWAAPDGCRCEGGMPVMQELGTNAIELAAALAPRPQLIVSVGQDPTRAFPEVGWPFVRQVYELSGARDYFEHLHLPEEGHDFGPSKRRAVYDFFARRLGLAHLDEDLARIVIERPDQLAVFGEQRPLPASAVQGSAAVGKAFAGYLAELRSAADDASPGAPPVEPVVEYAFREAGPADEALIFTPPGFERVGQPRVAAGSDTGVLRLRVRDESGRPALCRVNVVGPDGNFYEPADNPLKIHSLTGLWPKWPRAWGNRPGKAPIRYFGRFFYCGGDAEITVPAGNVRVEVWKGFEYRPEVLTTAVNPGQSPTAEVQLTRTLPISRLGYWSGDPHVHIPRQEEADEQRILDLMVAEDIHYATILAYNEPAGPYHGTMDRMDSPQFRGLGQRSVVTRDDYAIVSGQEYRSSTFGHMNLFWLDELVLAGQSVNANNWPPYGQIAREAREAGGFAFHAHGGYAQEIYADAVQDRIDAVELLQFGVYRGIGLSDWYHLLNCGFRFPMVGASDYPACRKLGDCQTFVYSASKPAMDDWLRGAASGRSFVTTGPALFLEVNGHRPGERIESNSDEPVTLSARIRARCEVAPITHVQLIVNGRVRQEIQVPPDQGRSAWIDLEASWPAGEPQWVAARAYSLSALGTPDAESHTNPVYVYRRGRAPYEQTSLDHILAAIDSQIAVHRKRSFPEQAQVIAYFEKSRDILTKIREAGGAPSEGHPSDLARELPSLPDPGAREHTDEDLRAFLRPTPPKSMDEVLRSFDTQAGFAMQLVAKEPLVHDPIAAAFDENGQLYVCEMLDYPYQPQPGKAPLGTIRLLRDVNGDGQYDESHVFADQLLWAGGVAPWRGGVFVASPPDIWYLKDTDGDHRADVRRRVFTGFGTQNQQAMLNNLQWWLDHRIYGSTAGNGGTVRTVSRPDAAPVSVSGRDFRFDPVRDQFESITGTVQFGTTFDDWGNRFLCSESQPLHHAVLPQHYLARNPYLPIPTALQNLAPGPVPIFRISPIERWRMIRSSRRIAFNARPADSAGASHHVVDAAAGVTVYRGGAYPPEYYGQIFIADPQNNLVHRRILVPDGVTFQSRRADEQREFLRSSDNWFRPVNFLNAPDGTLYVLDMCREILETIHVPLDVARFVDFRSGRDRGRIYRLAPPGYRYPGPPRLGNASTEELVAALASPHGWWRDTAHRLLYERQDPAAEKLLRELLQDSPRPVARLHALWSLHGLQRLLEDDVLRGLEDEHTGMQEQALALAEPWLNKSPAVRDRVLALATDSRARIQLQTAFSLGELSDERSAAALANLARTGGTDPWLRAAILSSTTNHVASLFRQLAVRPFVDQGAGIGFLEQLATVAGQRGHQDECLTLLGTIEQLEGRDRQWRLIAAMGRPLARAGRPWQPDGLDDPRARDLLERTWHDAERIGGDERQTPAERQRAIELLSQFAPALTGATLEKWLAAAPSESLQSAVVRALSVQGGDQVPRLLVENWLSFPPATRVAALEVMLSRREWTRQLLDAAQDGRIPASQLDLGQRALLLRSADAEVQSAAQRLFGSSSTRRSDVIAAYQACLRLERHPERGEAVFRRDCSGCHRLKDFGTATGPDLSASANRETDVLLTHILDPNQYVLPTYEQYVIIDDGGRTITGLIAAQTATSVSLKRENNQTDTVLRSQIAEMNGTGRSLMPEGFEQKISLQEMADLICFLQSVRPTSGAAALDIGTLPGLVEPDSAP
ncbi:MAG: PVC-type heme-binding CxxCH protein [Pirellulaceae bacterium]